MIPILPREFLWADLNTMEEFFRLDPVNEDFFETFVKLREEPLGVKLDAVKVFNEVYYTITRFHFEQAFGGEVPKYASEIKANLGWNYSAELVLSMAYWLTEIAKERMWSQFRVNLRDMYIGCDYWKPFSQCYEQLRKSGKWLKYDFKPRPISPQALRKKYVSWRDVTMYYNIEALIFILDLYNPEDGKEVAAMIKGSLNSSTPKWIDYNEVISVLDTRMGKRAYEICEETPPQEEALQGHIRELEAEVERLNTLMEEKKQSGKDRKFTLVQMVDYCKGCVDWNDVKSIVAMLNKLLRQIGTDEDSELVDSIEAEFINRKYGDTVMGDKNEFTGNSAHNTIALPRGMTPEQALRLLQNKKKEDGEEG